MNSFSRAAVVLGGMLAEKGELGVKVSPVSQVSADDLPFLIKP